MNRTVILAVDDMFFASKIRAAAEALAIDVKFVRSVEQLTQSTSEARPDLMVVDLHNKKVDPFEVARSLKASSDLDSIPLLGFFSHVETELQRAALSAGYDRVIPRSVLARDLAAILKGE